MTEEKMGKEQKDRGLDEKRDERKREEWEKQEGRNVIGRRVDPIQERREEEKSPKEKK